MQDHKSRLKKAVVRFRKKLKGKVLFIGVGNRLKRDDAAGLILLEMLKSGLKMSDNLEWYFIDAGTAPENFVGWIEKTGYDTIVILDAVEFGASPGSLKIIEIPEISTSGLTTHNLSPNLFMRYLKEKTRADIFMLGIQPRDISFGESLSSEVIQGLELFIAEFWGCQERN